MSRILARLVLGAAVVLLLQACGGAGSEPTSPASVTTAAEVEATGAEEPEDAQEGSGGKKLEEVALPENFPDHVPLYDGPVTSATELLMGGEKYMWDLHVRADDSGAAIDEVREQLVAAGFPEQRWSEVGELKSGLFRTEELRIAVQTAKDINGEMLLYSIMEE